MGYARVVGKCAAIYGQIVWRLSERTFSNKDDPGPIFFFLLKDNAGKGYNLKNCNPTIDYLQFVHSFLKVCVIVSYTYAG